MPDYDVIIGAIVAGDIDALEDCALIVESFPAGRDDFTNRTWIAHAVDCGPLPVIAWMLARGVPLDFESDEGWPILHCAIDRAHPDKHEVLRALIAAGAPLDVHGFNDWTPAHLAAARHDLESLRILRAAGADFGVRTRIDDFATPLEEAKHLGAPDEIVRFLESIG
ncbi:MAG: ankyrin repeat domain-containing protein [Planctomycetes bacterium]|nr:ankyrin repeat domain-containing protein [Planctomycetota bacterium]